MASNFNKSTHIRYFLRCLKTHLPTAYTSNDSQRMTLAFFVLCGLDLLGALEANTTEDEREAYVAWIYTCQHPDGGFRGFTGADLGEERTQDNEHWDPANIAATYFALASLVILGDDLSWVKRSQCLRWLKRLQLSDGTFGEALGGEGDAHSGRDMRFCYCAAAIRWILASGTTEEEDIDVDGLVRFIEASQTYEGGFANGPFHEAHAGWTYCAIAALSLLGTLHPRVKPRQLAQPWPSDDSVERMLGWLVNLQTSLLQEEDLSISDSTEAIAQLGLENEAQQTPVESTQVLSPEDPLTDGVDAEPLYDELQWAGLTGRCNKVADTCYTFWAGGSLTILNSVHLLDQGALRRYLLEKTQHRIGGFGKLPGDAPDIMHSCLGLAGLAGMGEPDLMPYDPSLCLSMQAKHRLESLPWRQRCLSDRGRM
ncbi:MAG: hypothetical protein LQ339_004662 [Xanthoria mediterranea]|nr:MAG: hypothetical protein LQ339_004662 [Xanthoria mediterranea]